MDEYNAERVRIKRAKQQSTYGMFSGILLKSAVRFRHLQKSKTQSRMQMERTYQVMGRMMNTM